MTMLEKLLSKSPLPGTRHQFSTTQSQMMSSNCRQAILVLSGSIEIQLPSPIEGRFCWQTLSPGDWLFPSSDIDTNTCPNFWIHALSTATVLICRDTEFRNLLRSESQLATELIEGQRRRTSALRREVMRLRMQTAEGRFMHYLLSENQFTPDGRTLLNGYFQEIAMQLNLAPATLSRTLADMQRKGHFQRKGRQFSLNNQQADNGFEPLAAAA
jgi:CRP-like cAMP-binding protein